MSSDFPGFSPRALAFFREVADHNPRGQIFPGHKYGKARLDPAP